MAIENEAEKVQFLLNFSNFSCDFLPEKLKTHFSDLCLTTAKRFKTPLPKALTDDQFICKHCSTQFTENNCSVKIIPKIKPGIAMRRILRKVKNLKKLSLVERKLAMRVHAGNGLAIKCLMCFKKTVKRLNKPQEAAAPIEPFETPKLTAKKKKKKKRKTAILNFSVSSNTTPEIITITDNPNTIKPSTGRASYSQDFIPLVASTPFTKKRNKMSNPLLLTKKLTNSKQKDKRSSLKRLLEEESSASQSSVRSLKDFLSRVNP